MSEKAGQAADIGLSVFLAVFCGFVVYYPVTDTDVWWHLSSAREMVRQGGILRADPFSFTTEPVPWINIHWFYQLCAYGLFMAGGVKALLVMKGAVFSSAILLFYHASAKTGSHAVRLFIFCTAAYWMRYLVLDRPVVVSLFCMATFLFVLERWRITGNSRLLFWLIPVQILWVNIQGLFMIGPAIILIYIVESLVERPSKKVATPLVALALSTLVASLVTPYGVKALFLPFKLLGRLLAFGPNPYSTDISENVPLLKVQGYDQTYVVAVIVFSAAVLLLSAIRAKQLRVAHALVFGVFFFLAWSAVRNVLLFLFVSAFIASYHLSEMRFARRINTASAAAAIVLCLFCVVSHTRVLRRCPSDMISPFRIPRGAAEYLKANPVEGNLFNSERHGGYLLWTLYPPRQVFMDGRISLRTPRFFEEYLGVLDDPGRFDAMATEFNVTQVLLPDALFPRFYPLAGYLLRSNGWRLVHADEASVLFVRDSMALTPAIHLDFSEDRESVFASIRARYRENPAIQNEAVAAFSGFLTKTGIR